jgi:transcriptional regulator with XRE-family HTH domain
VPRVRVPWCPGALVPGLAALHALAHCSSTTYDCCMNKKFAQWLSITMDNRGVSGNELAERLGVNISQVSRWRHGHTLPSLQTIDRIAHAFRVDPARLAVLAGRLPLDMAKVEPLPMPEPKALTARVRDVLEGIKGLTPEQREAMIKAMKENL